MLHLFYGKSFITFVVSSSFHIWLVFITFMVGITVMVNSKIMVFNRTEWSPVRSVISLHGRRSKGKVKGRIWLASL